MGALCLLVLDSLHPDIGQPGKGHLQVSMQGKFSCGKSAHAAADDSESIPAELWPGFPGAPEAVLRAPRSLIARMVHGGWTPAGSFPLRGAPPLSAHNRQLRQPG